MKRSKSLSLKEAAEYLGIKTETLLKWHEEKKMMGIEMGIGYNPETMIFLSREIDAQIWPLLNGWFDEMSRIKSDRIVSCSK